MVVGRKIRGRPRKRWSDYAADDMREKTVLDRRQWRRRVENSGLLPKGTS